MRHDEGYVVATMGSGLILSVLLRSWRWRWRDVLWMPAAIALEAYGRFLGWRDYHYKRRDHTIWDIAATTKRTL